MNAHRSAPLAEVIGIAVRDPRTGVRLFVRRHRGALHKEGVDPCSVEIDDFQKPSRMFDEFPRFWQMADPIEHQSGDRGVFSAGYLR